MNSSIIQREKKREYKARYYAKHKAERIAYSIKWAKEHPDKYNANHIKYRKTHRNKLCERTAKWAKEHPDQRNAYSRNYNHQKRAAGGRFTYAAWEYLKSLFGYSCVYCKRRMKKLTQDHVTPLSKGGWHFSGNVVPACRRCNSHKRNSTLS